MKNYSKLLAALLAMLLLLSVLGGCNKPADGGEDPTTPGGTSAGGSETDPAVIPEGGYRVTLSDATVPAGADSFTLDVSLEGTPSVSVLILSVVVDEEFEVLGAVNPKTHFADLDTGSPASGFNLVFSDDVNVTKPGVIATVTINCAGASAGEHTVRLMYRDSCTADLTVNAPAGVDANGVADTAVVTIGK